MLESEAPARSPPYSMVVPCWITLISKDSIGAVTTLGTVEFLAPLGIAKSYLRPRPIPLLNNLRNRPAFRFGFAAEDVLDDHGGREGRGDVEDFEIAVIEKHAVHRVSFIVGKEGYSQRLPSMLILPDFARLVENVQLRVLGGEHVVHACAQLRGFVRSTAGAFG
jgi:hypothetical protein